MKPWVPSQYHKGEGKSMMQKYHLSITWKMQKRKVYTIKVAILGDKEADADYKDIITRRNPF